MQSGGLAYFATEKTDGERQLLVSMDLTAERGLGNGGAGESGLAAVFVDRSEELNRHGHRVGFKVRKFPGADELNLPAGTVLDGELVYNLSIKKEVFMVFDVLQVGVVNPNDNALQVLNLVRDGVPFRQRLAHLAPGTALRACLDRTLVHAVADDADAAATIAAGGGGGQDHRSSSARRSSCRAARSAKS